MPNHEALLEEHDFFTDLYVEDRRVLAGIVSLSRYDEEKQIFHAHDPATQFRAIVSGIVALKVHVPHLGPIPIQTLKGGDALGWSWLFAPYRWHFDARALDPVEALVFDAAVLRKAMADNQGLGFRLLQKITHVMAQRLQATRLQLLDVYEART
jgi:CRP-like cAMP-binding protein